MNHYKYIALQIQDLSTTDLVHSAVSFCPGNENNGEDYWIVSREPLTICISSNNLQELLEAKQIMEETMNNIYEAAVLTNYTDIIKAYKEFKITPAPIYLNNFVYYKSKRSAILNKHEPLPAKKLNKNRFQIVQTFVNKIPDIELYSDEEF